MLAECTVAHEDGPVLAHASSVASHREKRCKNSHSRSQLTVVQRMEREYVFGTIRHVTMAGDKPFPINMRENMADADGKPGIHALVGPSSLLIKMKQRCSLWRMFIADERQIISSPEPHGQRHAAPVRIASAPRTQRNGRRAQLRSSRSAWDRPARPTRVARGRFRAGRCCTPPEYQRRRRCLGADAGMLGIHSRR